VRDGSIVITPIEGRKPRADWVERIEADVALHGPYPVVIEDKWGKLDPNDFDEADLGPLAEDEDWHKWR
jgi:hypothetical protein